MSLSSSNTTAGSVTSIFCDCAGGFDFCDVYAYSRRSGFFNASHFDGVLFRRERDVRSDH